MASQVSYADAAAKGAKQSPQEAAAPQQPEVVSTESPSTASLIDVDLPSVHTVKSDFMEQDIKTDTQAQRREREVAAAKAAKAEQANNDKKKAAAEKRAKGGAGGNSWLARQFSQLSDGSAGALAFVNTAGVVGLGGFLGYRAWGLYERDRLSWQNVGVGVGILAAVGAVEAVLGRYLYKAKKDDEESS